MRRTIIIGDVHGCADEVLDLFAKVGLTKEDEVIFVGDLVDRGPKSREAIEIAMEHDAVLGNHEEKHLAVLNGTYPEKMLAPHHHATRAQLDTEHFAWMKNLPLSIELPEYGAAVVHAGVLPGIRITDQQKHILLHAQHILPPGDKTYWPSRAPAGFRFWTSFWTGPPRVIFGHSALSQPMVSEWAVGIDTGCVFGRSLTAVILPGWEVVSVPARKEYFRSKKRRVQPYPVQGGVETFS